MAPGPTPSISEEAVREKTAKTALNGLTRALADID
jgi:hypothetical protein